MSTEGVSSVTPEIKAIIQSILSVFETGSVEPKYHKLVVMADGKDHSYQITYGMHQTTEQGHLAELISLYLTKADDVHNAQFKPYSSKIGRVPLYADKEFKRLLIDAGLNDEAMKAAQREFFDGAYWTPAERFFHNNEFEENLSMLVIYDSYIHSGGVPTFLRNRFSEKVPVNGGNERKWIESYTDARHQWFRNNSSELLSKCVYRTQCFKNQITIGNWDLSLPVNANGTIVPKKI